jgi:hypothetical protein
MRMRRLSFLKLNWKALFTLAVFLFAVSSVFAQDEGGDLEETLKKLSESAAKGYVGPIVSAFGSNLNGGWFHKTPAPKIFGLNIEFGLVGMGTLIPDEQDFRYFSTSGSFRFDSEQAAELFDPTGNSAIDDAIINLIISRDFNVSISGATIIGASDDYITIILEETEIPIPDPNNPGENMVVGGPVVLDFGGLGDFLANVPFIPFAAPQASVGTILGTQAVFRYIPEVEIPLIDITEDIGKFSWFGWGIQHNPAVFFPTPLPLDISLCFFKQTLKLGNVFEANTTAYGLTVSKRLGIGLFNITPYAGYLIEKSNLHFSYDFTLDEGLPIEQTFDVDFELEGENKSRITLGVGIKLLMFNINADYNIGNYNSITVGVMIGL